MKLQQMAAAIKKLSRHNKYLLQHLVSFLVLVSENAESNKMDSGNIGIVFGPNMLWRTTKKDNLLTQVNAMHDQRDVADVIKFLIEHYDNLFAQIETERRTNKQKQIQQKKPTPPAKPPQSSKLPLTRDP